MCRKRHMCSEHLWAPLASQQEEMDGAIVMYQEAMDQVSGRLGSAVAL